VPSGPYVQHWAGPWSLLSCSYFGTYYTHTVAELLETRIPHCIITTRKGHSACYFPQKEMDAFGADLRAQIFEQPSIVARWAHELKKESDAIRTTLKKLERKPVDAPSMATFEAALRNYTAPHLAVKKVVDYLSSDALKKALPALEEARLYSETVYGQTEAYMKNAIRTIAKKSDRPIQQIESLTYKELDAYFKNGKLPPDSTLEKRYENAALIFHEGDFVLAQGKEAQDIEHKLAAPADSDVIRGTCAQPGKAAGIVRIVLDPFNPGRFDTGDILVTAMTRPEYLPLFKKAAAVVTDGGGILSHAAIVARELKVPCVIGTLNATKRLKSGESVEVDAGAGTAKIIQKKV